MWDTFATIMRHYNCIDPILEAIFFILFCIIPSIYSQMQQCPLVMAERISINLPGMQEKKISLLGTSTCLMTCRSELHLIEDKIQPDNTVANKGRHGVTHVWYKLRGKLKQRLCQREKQLNTLQNKIHIVQACPSQSQNINPKYSKSWATRSRLWSSFSETDAPYRCDKTFV